MRTLWYLPRIAAAYALTVGRMDGWHAEVDTDLLRDRELPISEYRYRTGRIIPRRVCDRYAVGCEMKQRAIAKSCHLADAIRCRRTLV